MAEVIQKEVCGSSIAEPRVIKSLLTFTAWDTGAEPTQHYSPPPEGRLGEEEEDPKAESSN
jgi:hypothetical protein